MCTGGIEHVDGQFAWTADGRASTIVLERYNSSGYSVSDIAGNGLGENVTSVSRSPHSLCTLAKDSSAEDMAVNVLRCSGSNLFGQRGDQPEPATYSENGGEWQTAEYTGVSYSGYDSAWTYNFLHLPFKLTFRT